MWHWYEINTKSVYDDMLLYLKLYIYHTCIETLR